MLTQKNDDNAQLLFSETALEELIKNATQDTYDPRRVLRAAQSANMMQPDIISYKDAGEMFLQQIVYSPIAELFCAFSTAYCADKKVKCAHAVLCHESGKENVQYSVSCLPDAAVQLVNDFYVIAMMELKVTGTGEPYQRDFYRCKLMTTMSVMAISDFLVVECKKSLTEIDIAIPFIQGSFEYAELFVTRLKGAGAPKIHKIAITKFWDSPSDPGKLNLLATLAVILARIVKATTGHKFEMASYFRRNYNWNSDAMKRNAIKEKSSSRDTNISGSSKRSASGKGESSNSKTRKSPSENENAAKIAASQFGQVESLDYPFSRIRDLVIFDEKNQREADFKFFQQESPFFFKGVSKGKRGNQDMAVFCKIWREGDQHTSRANVEKEIQFYKRANANKVPSPQVVDTLTTLDVKCTTVLDKYNPSIYHVLVTQYHRNDAVDEKDFLTFALLFLQAVRKLHDNGIIHCDLKPSNILWDAVQKTVVLIDFEHAQEAMNAQWYTTTRKYEAPEISLGSPHSRMSDAFSVGKSLDVIIKQFPNPVASNVAAVVASLLIESDSKRMLLMEAERQIEHSLDRCRHNLTSAPNDNNSFPTKRCREDVDVFALEV